MLVSSGMSLRSAARQVGEAVSFRTAVSPLMLPRPCYLSIVTVGQGAFPLILSK
jgi:hypothetical protein